MEIWKDIEGYEGLYQVSNLGRVKSLSRLIERERSYYSKEKLLKVVINKYNYCKVNLYKSNKIKSFTVHRLVANTFLSNPYNKPQVNHIDGDKCNNCVNNLEWTTASENTQHAIDTGLKNINGSKHGMAKLTEEEVLEIRTSNELQKNIAKKYNISQGVVSSIKLKKTWRHI